MAGITRNRDLNPPRRHRTYPRAIKRGRHNDYRVKRPGDHGTPPTIHLLGPKPQGPPWNPGPPWQWPAKTA